MTKFQHYFLYGIIPAAGFSALFLLTNWTRSNAAFPLFFAGMLLAFAPILSVFGYMEDEKLFGEMAWSPWLVRLVAFSMPISIMFTIYSFLLGIGDWGHENGVLIMSVVLGVLNALCIWNGLIKRNILLATVRTLR